MLKNASVQSRQQAMQAGSETRKKFNSEVTNTHIIRVENNSI
jgi:hypothetical protein